MSVCPPLRAATSAATLIKLAALAAVVTLAIGASGCRKPSAAATDGTGSGSGATARAYVPVRTRAVVRERLRPNVRVVADVLPWRRVTVAAEAIGRVRALKGDVGDTVKAGALLARVDATKSTHNLRLVRARREQARAAIDIAKRQLARVSRLAKKGIVAPAQLDAARNRVRLAGARLDAARAQLGLTGRRHADSRILAPFAGVIAKRHAEVGSYLTPGRPVVTLMDLTRVKVRASLALADALHVKRGQHCRVRVKLLGPRSFDGRVHTVGAAADPRSRRVEVDVAIDNKDGKLKPGLIAKVTFYLAAARDALLVPSSAIVEQFEIPYVFVAKLGGSGSGSGSGSGNASASASASSRVGVAERRRIQRGKRYGLRTEVLSGLHPGDALIVVGQEGLSPGARIKVVGVDGKPAAKPRAAATKAPAKR